MPVYLPQKYYNGKYYVIGNFCTFADYQISIYKKEPEYDNGNEFYYELLGSTDIVQNIEGASWEANIEVVNFGNERLLLIKPLGMMAHGSEMVFFRYDIDTNKIELVEEFWSDAGSPVIEDLEKDGNPEIIESGRIYPETSTDEKMDFMSFIRTILRYDSVSHMFQTVSDTELERLSKIIINNDKSPDFQIYSLKEYNDTRLDERNKVKW